MGHLESLKIRIKSNVGALIENPGIYPFMSGYDNLKLLNETKILTILIQLSLNLIWMIIYITKQNIFSWYETKIRYCNSFLNQPQLIILDEPMNGLDPKAVRDVRELIVKSTRRNYFLISSHILSELVKLQILSLSLTKVNSLLKLQKKN